MFPYRRLPGHITGLYVFTVANFLVLCHIALVQGDITVFSLKLNKTVESDIQDMPAYFGAHIIDDGIYGQVVYADPPTACETILPPPRGQSPNPPDLLWFVLISRNDCDFSRKVLMAQEAGYDAAIVHNVGSNDLEPMGPGKDTIIVIPSVFIGANDGLLIRDNYTYEKGFELHLAPDFPVNLNAYLLPFAVGVGTCFLILLLVTVVKCIRDRRQRQRHRLPSRMLKKLKTKKFKKGDHDDICAICLEDYVEGEKLRVLPCSHTYHMKCIDPWLTESRRTCPVCKRKVMSRHCQGGGNSRRAGSSSDSSSDSEQSVERRVPDERTPLLAAAINVANSDDDSLAATGGRVNHALLVDEGARRGHSAFSSYQTIPGTTDHDGNNASTSGGSYQSFGSPPIAGSLTMISTVATICPSQQQQLFAVPSSAGDLLSSGEHSLNGDVVDFAPVEEWFVEWPRADATATGPVEIAVDVSGQQTPTISSSVPTQDAQVNSAVDRQRASGGRRSRPRRRSDDHDMVV